MPRLPGDIVENNGQSLTDLLHDLRTNAARPPVPTSHHRKITPFMPGSTATATHVYQKIGKPAKLGPLYDGPFEIVQRIGKSCLKIRVGNWATGQPRHELTHWSNCYPAPEVPLVEAVKAKRGRRLNANASSFTPRRSERLQESARNASVN